VISCHVTASSCELQPCRKSNAQYTQVFGLLHPLPHDFRQMTSLPGQFWSPKATWRHFLSCDCLFLRAIALQEVKRTVYASFRPSTATARWLPVKWRHFRITSRHLRSCNVISCHVLPPPASYSFVGSQMHSIRKLSVFYIHFQVTSGQMTSLPGHFPSPEVTWHNFLSCDCLFLRATAL